MGRGPGELSYLELTEPLRALTKKNARFIWGEREISTFEEIKRRLCSDRVLLLYDTRPNTRLYVDSSHIGTQPTVAQCHTINGQTFWTPFMYKMYALCTHVPVVTDHQPLIPIFNSPNKPNQFGTDRYRTKLLPFRYDVVYEPGKCLWARHSPECAKFNEQQIEESCIKTGTDIYTSTEF